MKDVVNNEVSDIFYYCGSIAASLKKDEVIKKLELLGVPQQTSNDLLEACRSLYESYITSIKYMNNQEFQDLSRKINTPT